MMRLCRRKSVNDEESSSDFLSTGAESAEANFGVHGNGSATSGTGTHGAKLIIARIFRNPTLPGRSTRNRHYGLRGTRFACRFALRSAGGFGRLPAVMSRIVYTPVVRWVLLIVFMGGGIRSRAADQAVAYQINPQHTGAIVTGSMAPALHLEWTVPLGGPISYPIIEGGMVFVTVADSSNYGTDLYALDAQTGHVVWGPTELGGTYYWSALTYEYGTLFALNEGGVLRAFDAATGTERWNEQLPDQYEFSAPPTASNGVVYAGGAGDGGTVYAVNEVSGEVLWTAEVENGDNSSPAVGSDGIYVSYPGPQTYKLDISTGAEIWHYSGPSEGGGGADVALYNNRLYTRDPVSENYIFDATAGTILGEFGTTSSALAPALYGNQLFSVTAGSGPLQATDLLSEKVNWSFNGDGDLDTTPIYLNGFVYVGSSQGNLYAVDATTGRQVWTTNVGSAINGPNEGQLSSPLTGMAAAGDLFVVPAGANLVAYTFKVTPAPTVALAPIVTISGTSATVAATVYPAGKPLTVYFAYGPTSVYGKRTASQSIAGGADPVTVTALINGLGVASTYHFQCFAVTTSGTIASGDEQFTTGQVNYPTAITGGAAIVAGSWAIVAGASDPDAASTTAYFQYGRTTAYGSMTAAQQLGDGTASVAVSGSLPGLVPATVYHYRLVAKNSIGTTYGADRTFTTPYAESPEVATFPPTNLAATGATLNADVNANGIDTKVRFQYGLTTAYASATATEDISDGISPALVSLPVSGLRPGTTYYYQVVASSAGGTAYGAPSIFTTSAASASAKAAVAARPAVAQAGHYTLLLGAASDADAPQGTGVAAMTVTPSGAVSIAGRLADGAPFSAGARIGSDGSFLLYATAARAGAHERVHGIVRFPGIPGRSDYEGILTWISSPSASAVSDSKGFETTTSITGSRQE